MYLMHVNTGSVDTADNWLAEYLSTPLHEWHGCEDEDDFNEKILLNNSIPSWDFCLVKVQENEKGQWEAV